MELKLSKLEMYILDELKGLTSINQEYIRNMFYNDYLSLQSEIPKVRLIKNYIIRKKKLASINGKLKRRSHNVNYAFNQLYLKKLVVNENGLDYNKFVQDYINRCKIEITQFEEIVKSNKSNIMSKCWLNNLYDYLHKAKETTIITGLVATRIYGSNVPKGGLICVGSEICNMVYPNEIGRKVE